MPSIARLLLCFATGAVIATALSFAWFYKRVLPDRLQEEAVRDSLQDSVAHHSLRVQVVRLATRNADLESEIAARTSGRVPDDLGTDAATFRESTGAVMIPVTTLGPSREDSVRERAYARSRLVASARTGRSSSEVRPVVIYDHRVLETRKISDRLKQLGFQTVRAAGQENAPPAVLTFGPSIDIEDVRLVAYALAEGGIFVSRIRRLERSARPNEIRIKSDLPVSLWYPVSGAQIQSMALPRVE